MAFTESERRQIRERDIEFGRNDNPIKGCNFPHSMAADVPCLGRLEVHHILPQMFGYTYLIALTSDIDQILNALTVCQNAHTGSQTYPTDNIHNDQPYVWRSYRNGNNNAFNEMQMRRKVIAETGQPYWNTKFDAVMIYQARKNTNTAQEEGWRFKPRRAFQNVA
ncbi:MAG TPA: hypothetical protein VF810_03095 [Patescibacteria group bacterium]